MAKAKKVLSVVLVALFTVMTVMSYVPAQAKAKKAATPQITIVEQPAAEYTVGDRMYAKVQAPNFTGKVEYRATLWDGTEKQIIEVWKTFPYYYKNWQPTGTTVFPITWIVEKPGVYNLTVYVRPVGSKASFSTYVKTANFTVKEKEVPPTPVTISSVADQTAAINEGETYALPTQLEAKMSDGSTKKVDVAWNTALDLKKVGDQVITGKVAGYDKDVKLTLTVKEVKLAIKNAVQSGSKKIEVTFNKKADATVTLKRGQVVTSAKVTWNDDKTVATLETLTNLLEAKYTVVAGDLTYDVEAKTEKLAKIALSSENAVASLNAATTATISYVAYNQFNEDITTNTTLAGTINWTAAPAATAVDNNAGKITITNTGAAWIPGTSKIIITGVDIATGIAINSTITVQSASKVASLKLLGVKNIKTGATDQLLNQGDIAASKYLWVVEYEALDQYGNKINSMDYINGPDNVLGNVDDPIVLNEAAGGTSVAWAADPSDATKALMLVTPGGLATDEVVVVTAVDVTSGANSTVTFNVEKNASIKTFTLGQPSGMLVAGEAVTMPFEAYDQYNNPVTTLAGLGGVGFTTANGAFQFSEDPISKVVTLKYTPATAGTAVVTTSIGTDVKTVTYTINATAVPTVVESISADAIRNMTNGAVSTLNAKSFVVKDQYNRAISVKTIGGVAYTLVVSEISAADTDVALTNNGPITSAAGSYDLAGTANAGEKLFRATIQKAGADVQGSELDFVASTIDKADIKEYKVVDITKLIAATTVAPTVPADYAAELEVYGYTADGTKVALNWATDIQAVNTVGKIAYTPATHKLLGTTITAAGKEETATILVAVNGANGVVTIREDVTITDAVPTPATMSVSKDSAWTPGATEKFDATNSVLALTVAHVSAWNTKLIYENAAAANRTVEVYFTVTDQYGVTSQINPSFYYISEDSVANAGTYSINNTTGALNITAANVVAGDKFTITAVTADGKSASLKVIVK